MEDSERAEPRGAGAEVLRARERQLDDHLQRSRTRPGRYSLAVSISEDEGATWRWTRHLEREPQTSDALSRQGQYHDPSITQARDGTLHATYSHFIPTGRRRSRTREGRVIRKAIKHAHFNEAWVRARP